MLKPNINKVFLFIAVMIVGIMNAPASYANDSSPDEAKAMAEKAAVYVKEHGADAAAVEFNKAESDFIHNDLYVFAINPEGVFLSHPIKQALVGKNMIDLTDANDFPLIKAFTEVESEGWVSYVWPHPVSKEIRPKKSYIINIDGFILGVGAYYEE